MSRGTDMSRTVLLFRDDPGLSRQKATILSAEATKDGIAVIVDRTIFYPEGGGQPCDSGTIAGRKILSVEERSGLVIHSLEPGDHGPEMPEAPTHSPLRPGENVDMVLDGARRRDFTEQHSAQHLLSATILSLCGAQTVSMHLGAEKSTIDVDIPFLGTSLLADVETLVNERIAQALPVLVHLCPPDDPASFPLRKRPPSGEEVIRIVDIGGIDYSPCCGTHVASTLELRLLAITGAEKYKGMMRLSFVAGGRAARYLSARSALLDQAAVGLGVTGTELPKRVAGLSQRLLARESDVDALLKLAARQRVELDLAREVEVEGEGSFAAECPAACASDEESAHPGRGRTLVLDGPGVESGATSALECSRAFAAAGRAAIVVSIPELTVCVAAPEGFHPGGQSGGASSLAKLLAPLLKESGGRGGGSGASFRARFDDRESLERFVGAARHVTG